MLRFLDEELQGCEDPRGFPNGKPLTNDPRYRYRFGEWRLLCLLHDDTEIVEVVRARHRRNVYR